MRYTEILSQVSQRTKKTIITDLSQSDLDKSSSFRVDSPDALQLTSLIWGKSLNYLDDITILRRTSWLVPDTETLSLREINISSLRNDLSDSGTGETFRIHGVSPVGYLLSALAKQSSWSITPDSSIASRLIGIYAERIRPAQVVEAVTFLFNTGTQGRLQQSSAQRDRELAAQQNLPPDLAKQARDSAKLRPELEKLLSPAQLAQLQSGQPVELSLRAMSPALRSAVNDYIRFSAASVGLTLDPSKSAGLGIRFLPPDSSPLGILGCMGFDKSGNLCYF